MYTTAEDLRAFWDSLFAHKILSEELAGIYLDTHWRFNDAHGYGCGLYKRLDNSMYWISGGDAGVGFYSGYLPREELTISVLSNVTNGEGGMRKAVLSALQEDL